MSTSLLHFSDKEYQKLLDQEIDTLLSQARIYFKRNFPTPDISFRLRGSNAGLAIPERNQLKFNNQLLITHGQQFITETAAHELAHLLAYQLFGKAIKPHGVEWQSIMINVFQQQPSVTHAYTTSMNRKDVYLYICQCPKTIEFSKIRHNRAQRGVKYLCRHCKGTLQYQGKKNGRRHYGKTDTNNKNKQRQLPL